MLDQLGLKCIHALIVKLISFQIFLINTFFVFLFFVDCTSVPYDKRSSGPGLVWLDEILCSGTEQNLLACPHDGLKVGNCSNDEDAGVRCTGMNHIVTKYFTQS